MGDQHLIFRCQHPYLIQLFLASLSCMRIDLRLIQHFLVSLPYIRSDIPSLPVEAAFLRVGCSLHRYEGDLTADNLVGQGVRLIFSAWSS